MGHGTYSSTDRHVRAETSGYYTAPVHETFKAKSINNAMSPHGISFREARDSEEHPNSVAIVVALDVTGSMGSVPHHLVKRGLPSMMDGIIKAGVKDPQVLFMGIGDHECDTSPLQVGQFESSDELLDKWLTDTYLEGGGGGNYGESYMLAWYFAARHTQIDCLEKRKQKGFLFTIGDEPVLRTVPGSFLSSLMGSGQFSNQMTSAELLKEAQEKYNVYHLHIAETGSGRRTEVQDGWKQMMGDNCIIIQSSDHVSGTISQIVSGEKKEAQSGSTEGVTDKPEEIL